MAQSEPNANQAPNQAPREAGPSSEHQLAAAVTAAVTADTDPDSDRDPVDAAMAVVDDDATEEVRALARDVAHLATSVGVDVVLHADARPLANAYAAGVRALEDGANVEQAVATGVRALAAADRTVRTDLDLKVVLRQALEERA